MLRFRLPPKRSPCGPIIGIWILDPETDYCGPVTPLPTTDTDVLSLVETRLTREQAWW